MAGSVKLPRDPYYLIREDLYGALERYLEYGIMPGGFLTSCLENDLAGACGRADHQNIKNIPNIIGYIYNHMPMGSWGSPEKVDKYVSNIRKENHDEHDQPI